MRHDAKPHTFVLLFDGTSHYGLADTNVLRLYRFLKPEDEDNPESTVEYAEGPGSPVTPIKDMSINPISRLADLALAWSIRRRILHHYRALMDKYSSHDRICLFGFSRGAYIARCLASMISAVGLLLPKHTYYVNTAWNLYLKSQDPEGAETARKFKKSISRNVEIDFLGVWDTVASTIRTHPITTHDSCVKVVCHAVALDERRSEFSVSPLTREEATANSATANATNEAADQKVHKEVWFVGCHGDVGGGKWADTEKHSLSNPPLLWMMKQLNAAGIPWNRSLLNDPDTPELVRAHFLPEAPFEGLASTANEPPSPSTPRSIQEVLQEDVNSPIRDSLGRFSPWWLLEMFPRMRIDPSTGKRSLHVPKGRHRHVPRERLLHSSVNLRNGEYRRNLESRIGTISPQDWED